MNERVPTPFIAERLLDVDVQCHKVASLPFALLSNIFGSMMYTL